MIKLNEEQKKLLKLENKRIDYYFKVENAVIDNSETFDNIYESHLFIVLSRFCNNNNIAFPSYNSLAELCYCSRSTIIKTMKNLEKKGLINKLLRNKKIKDKTVYESNLYTINNIKKYNITNEKNIRRKNSSRYEFLNLSKYSLLNQATIKNIENNTADLTEKRFIEIYNLTAEYIE